MTTQGARETPLLGSHRELGAKLTEFGGWEMPLQYKGIIAEHNAVRDSVGVFDVSHLGKLRISGEPATGLQETVTADVDSIEQGRAAYALVLEEDGGCIDDLFVYRVAAQEWLVVPNAANTEAVSEALARSGVEVDDEWDRWAILAIQGPRSFELFEKVWPGTGATDLRLHSFCSIDLYGAQGMVARTGYTGESGFELYAPADVSVRCFEALLEAGVTPVGLGARDTLRLEMGYPLYGHELTRSINPVEAGLGWAVAWESPFRGRAALTKVRDEGPRRKLFGVRCSGRGVPRAGHTVLEGDRELGEVTSGNYSPTLETGIALALGPPDGAADGDGVVIEGRGRSIEGVIVAPPFVARGRSK